MATGVLGIEKLNGDNYATWCIQVKSLLVTLDLWNAVIETCPEEEAEAAKWIINDSKALANITLSVRPTELIHIKNCTTARSAWNTLSSLYKADTASRKVNLFKKLVRFKFNTNQKFSTQINEFSSIIDELKEICIVLNDDLLSIFLLCALPDEMENFVIAIENRDHLPRYDKLISKIFEEELRQNNKNINQNETVFAANTKNDFKRNKKFYNNSYNNNTQSSSHIKSGQRQHEKKSNFNVNNIKCFRCGKKGHVRSQCRDNERTDFACSLHENVSSLKELFVLDSGATSHMCRNKQYFTNFTTSNQEIVLASGETINAEGIGEVRVVTEFCKLTLNNVWYVPKLHSNFISINKILKAGHSVNFINNKALMKSKEGNNILTAVLEEGMFIANVKIMKESESINCVFDESIEKQWHERYGHININDLNKLSAKKMVKGLDIKIPEKIDCVTCAVNKISAKPYKNYGSVQTTDLLEVVHTDLCGPIGVKSVGGSSYFMTFIDDYSHYISTYFLKNKSDVFEAFTNFAAIAEKQTGRQIKVVRSDNGKEFINSKFKEFFAKKGIVHQTTVCYSPQQNGVAERANRTLVEMARCLLEKSGLQQSLWGEAVYTATYLRNRSPTKVLGDVTPYEKWSGKQPSVFHFKTFGCDAIVLNKGTKPKGSKFLPKGLKMKFVGYQLQTKGYRLYNPQTRQIIVARDVIFFEQSFEQLKIPPEDDQQANFYFNIFKENVNNKVDSETQMENVNGEVQDVEEIVLSSDVDDDDNQVSANSNSETEREDTIFVDNKRKRGRPKIVRTGAKGRPRKIYVTESGPEMLNSIIENPNSVNEALNSEDSEKWKEAMQAEYNSLIKNKTWQLVEKPSDKNIIGCKWVFVVKRSPDGAMERCKARLVAHGCSQKFNVVYRETLAPVVRHSTIRLLLALAAKHKLLVNHIDIEAAYLNGDLEDDVYMMQPKMFEDQHHPNKVCKLNKALYGLKQAGREWNRKVNDILREMGFKRCQSDTCVYVKRNDYNVCFIAIYVDDMLLACNNSSEMETVIVNLNKHIKAVDRGSISFYLGMEVNRDGLRGDITIHQKRYTEELLERWGMSNCKPAATPWPSGTVLKKCENKCENLDTTNYQSLIGALMYLAVITRPDLMHVVSKLSQFNTHPHDEHFVAAKYVLRYLKKNPIGKIIFSNNLNNFECFTASDWASDSHDRKSYSGFVMFMAGGPIAWESKKQSVVALSTMEAEYIALCQGTKETIFHRCLLREMEFEDYVVSPTPILCDNQRLKIPQYNRKANTSTSVITTLGKNSKIRISI